MTDPRILLLIAASAGFAALIAAELAGPDDPAPAPRDAAPVEAARAPPPPPPERPDQLIADTLARPLFSPGRRPPDTAQATSGASPDLSDKRLAGIVIEPERRLAIFHVNGARPMTLAEGETIGGWRIDGITATEVSLVGAGGNRTLQLVPEPGTAARPRPARTAAARPPAQAAAPQPVAGAQSAPARAAPPAAGRTPAAANQPAGPRNYLAPPAANANARPGASP